VESVKVVGRILTAWTHRFVCQKKKRQCEPLLEVGEWACDRPGAEHTPRYRLEHSSPLYS
jgi:hypothetical protein